MEGIFVILNLMKMEWIKPFADRHTTTPYMHSGSMGRAVSIIYPEFVYFFIGQVVTLVSAYVIGTGQYGTETSELFKNYSLFWAALIRIAAVTIAIIPLLPALKGEKLNLISSKGNRTFHIVLVAVFGASLALFCNSIAMITELNKTSDAFSQTSTTQFSLPIWLGLIVYGIVTPITEEIVHRGLIYNRLRRYFNLPFAMIVGPAIFGFAHGNIVQLVYGFLMGIMICYVYERYGAFIYVVVFHCAANAIVYVCMSIPQIRSSIVSIQAIVVTGFIAVACIGWMMREKLIDT